MRYSQVMRTIVLAAMALLGACAYPTVAQIERDCGSGEVPFEDSWPCVRANVPRLVASRDVLAGYIAAGDVIAERVRAGTMTQAEARLAIAQAEQHGRAIESGRRPPVVLVQQMPQTTYTAPPLERTVFPPQQSVTCYRYGNMVTCN